MDTSNNKTGMCQRTQCDIATEYEVNDPENCNGSYCHCCIEKGNIL